MDSYAVNGKFGALFGNIMKREVVTVGLFRKKLERTTYDREKKKPVLRCSICTGEQVAGFQDIYTGNFEEVMLIQTAADLELFKTRYGITEEIAKIY